MAVKPAHPPADTAAARTVGVIDIGSGATRMMIARLGADGRPANLESLQRAVPLGADVFSKGRIRTQTANLAIEVLRGFLWICKPYDVRTLRAVATSAVREATNRELFVERVYMATGIDVDVITSAEEHRLVYVAVRDAFASAELEEDRESLLVELSSSSVELTRVSAGQVVFSDSFPFGTLRILGAVRAGSPGAARAPAMMRRLVVDAADAIERSCPLGKVRGFIAVGAEARYAADRVLGPSEGVRVRTVARRDFLRAAAETAKVRPEELARRTGLAFEDCETLGPALLAYAELLKRTPAPRVLVPYVSMRDGLILELAADEMGLPLSDVEAQIYASAQAIGRRFQVDEAHASHVAVLAVGLFDALAAEHGLGRRERRMLHVAALLHDIGAFVSPNSHHRHTEYLIQASDVFGLRPEEKAIVACVARYHRRALPQTGHPSYAALPREARATVSKLAALLRVADAMDRGHAQKVPGFALEISRRELVIQADTDEDIALEQQAVRAKGDLFEEVFGRKVVLQGGAAGTP